MIKNILNSVDKVSNSMQAQFFYSKDFSFCYCVARGKNTAWNYVK